MDIELLKILICPSCKSTLQLIGEELRCSNNTCMITFPVIDGIPIMITPQLAWDLKLTREKWEGLYKKQLENNEFEKLYQEYMSDHYENIYRQLSACKQIKDIVYLEIGCGQMFLGQAIAERCKLIVGIDVSLSALQIAKKMLDKKGITNYLLILGDIKRIPIKKNSIDLIYGGGVIEHFKGTQNIICEMYRILAKEGVSFNTIPYLNLGSLTYRQLWGNIPSFPVLKQLAELVHIKLLKSKYMKFGYELSFTANNISKLHKKAGFKKISVRKFDTKLMFDFIPFNFIKTYCIYLANNYRLFWPMIKVIAEK